MSAFESKWQMSVWQIISMLLYMLVALLALKALGMETWSAWAQLGAGTAVMVTATFIAPEAFGWREPKHHH